MPLITTLVRIKHAAHAWCLCVALVFNGATAWAAASADAPASIKGPEAVAAAYLRAVLARDYVEAYRFISADDRRIKDLNKYAQQRGAFVGFALDAAKKLASFGELQLTPSQIATNRIQIGVRRRSVEPNKIASLMRHWDMRQLNSLETGERIQLLEELDRRQRDGSLPMIDIVDKPLELVKEFDEWRVFLNWAAGVTLPLRLSLSDAPDLEVALSKKEVTVQPGELFELSLRMKNRSRQTAIVRVAHLVDPEKLANFLDLVECGFIRPVTLEPGIERVFDARYLVRGNLPESIRQLTLTYDFALLKFSR